VKYLLPRIDCADGKCHCGATYRWWWKSTVD